MQYPIAVFVCLALAVGVHSMQKPYIVNVYNVEMPPTAAPTGKLAGHIITPICTGVIIGRNAILTTVTCTEKAFSQTLMPMAVSTAIYESNVDFEEKSYYRVTETIKHPNYDMATKANNLAILKVSEDINMVPYVVSDITVGDAVAPLSTLCDVTYWQTGEMTTTQLSQDREVVTCTQVMEGKVCAKPVTSPTTPNVACKDSQDGAALVCGDRLAGIFTFVNANLCLVGEPLVYMDVSKDKQWIWDQTNAASAIHLSVAALVVAIVAQL